ncbi:sialidase family protein [Flavobacteriaceae bacterium]|nr:glycoside hydrolase [Flavobacteriaceae bacterium]MDC0958519.1 sialidase family protein [Flavobacteriaceae bacterium]
MKYLFKILILLFGTLSFSQELIFKNLFDSSLNSEIACYRIPSIITSTNGTLIAAIDERNNTCGDLKWNRNINIVLRKSYNEGKTWTKIERIVDYPLGESASDPSMIVDRQTKDIFLFYNYMNLDKAKDIYRFMVIKSNDNGESWSSPKDITDQITKKDWKNDFMFITSGRGTQSRDGTLLHCLVNLNKGTHVFGSNDHGKNWFLIDYPLKPGDESKIIELSNGDWLVNSRVNSNKFRYSHISKDRGKSWLSFENKDLSDPACNASIINYNISSEKLLLFSNAFDSNERKNLSLSISYDQGLSWKNNKTIYKGNSAYSSMTKLKNGDIGLFFEKDNYTKNVFVRVPKKWVLDK